MELDTVVCGDCLDVMIEMPDECVNLIVTDPPYGIDKARWDKTLLIDWFGEAMRILKPTGAAYIFGHSITLSRFQTSWEHRGVAWEARPVWVYEDGPRSRSGWTSKHEDCLVYCGPGHNQLTPKEPSIHKDPRWGDKRLMGDVWRVPRVLGTYVERVDFPTQKPVALMIIPVTASSKPGDLVFDPFIGSGTTAVAALKTGRHFFGCDINPDYVALANERIERTRQELAQLELAL